VLQLTVHTVLLGCSHAELPAATVPQHYFGPVTITGCGAQERCQTMHKGQWAALTGSDADVGHHIAIDCPTSETAS
jgi:hypothetical protein